MKLSLPLLLSACFHLVAYLVGPPEQKGNDKVIGSANLPLPERVE